MGIKCQFFGVLGLVFLLGVRAPAQSVPPLINYQGRLTDQTGAPLAAGAYSLQFRLWDSPTGTNANSGGDLIWGQQYSTIAVQSNGVFNVILGAPGGTNIPNASPSVNNLAYAFSGPTCFLGVTVVSSNGITILLPREILPRQQLLSVPYALMASTAATATFATNAILASNAITAQLATNLAPGIVALANLVPRPLSTNAPVGGMAVSATENQGALGSGPVPNLSITITTTGRPVLAFLTAADGTASSGLFIDQDSAGSIALQRDGANIGIYKWGFGNSSGVNWFTIPASLMFLDIPAGGTHSYSIQVLSGSDFAISNTKLVVFEF